DDTSSTASTSAGTGYPNPIGNPAPLFPVINRGYSDFDIRHNATISWVWDAPNLKSSSGIVRAITNGWEMASIFHVATGTHFTPFLTSDQAGETKSDDTGAGLGLRPDVAIGGACANLTNPGNVQHYIRTNCFTYPQPVTVNGITGTVLGNAQRNLLTAP